MAALDYGVIALKNGELLGGRASNGIAAEFEINGLRFYKYIALQMLGYYDLESDHTPRYVRSRSSCYQGKYAWVEYDYTLNTQTRIKKEVFNYNGMNITIKRLGDQYHAQFRYDGDKYDILFGFDVSLGSFWVKRTHRVVKKFLTKYSNNVTIKSHHIRPLRTWRSNDIFEGEWVISRSNNRRRYKKLPPHSGR